MIVPKMSDEEIYEEIKNDFSNLDDKIRYSENKFQAALRKATHFPFMQSFSYETHERHNRFVITFTARGHSDYNHPLVSVYCQFRDKKGEAAAAINWKEGIIIIYLNHFFERYRERVLNDSNVSINDTIAIFFSKEWCFGGIRITKEIEDVYHCFEGHFSEDRVDVLVLSNEGYVFGVNKGPYFVMKTIITDKDLSDKQRALFPKLSDIHQRITEQMYFGR